MTFHINAVVSLRLELDISCILDLAMVISPLANCFNSEPERHEEY